MFANIYTKLSFDSFKRHNSCVVCKQSIEYYITLETLSRLITDRMFGIAFKCRHRLSILMASKNKLMSCVTIALGGSLTFAGYNLYTGDHKFYQQLVMPFIHHITDAETAHTMAIKLAKHGFVPHLKEDDTLVPILKTSLWSLEFNNPIGLAAGFDKNGQAINGLAKLGFGFIEVGSCTPQPQPGNEKPRVYRLIEDKAIINRYGFNSIGHNAVKANIENSIKTKESLILGLNLGKNKLTENMVNDYVEGLIKFKDSEAIDYFVLNISSPNTSNLRDLQNKTQLKQLIERVLKVRIDYQIEKPLLIKIAPDLDDNQLKDITDIINEFASNKSMKGIDGLIISNTTVYRHECLKSDNKLVTQKGGLSGLPLQKTSTDLIKRVYQLTGGKVPIIGVGGVFTGSDAYDKIRAGASLIQIYTALTYEGPQVVNEIKQELANILRSNGFKNVTEAVGIDHLK
ncbi:dihydroorotate dehydrogenase (quinone), mitochondrial-like [Oppia nitens]|uniref:dihydroorotate dehydrogenase (quinone), mitochondrial-like n=1 Tax=Oppia nitens TaxID=1686743 RepID=UPI0023DCC351|nr:dihydroorotate dehydrogenase (quinone), mitochondrial-like [Oppia nitens]